MRFSIKHYETTTGGGKEIFFRFGSFSNFFGSFNVALETQVPCSRGYFEAKLKRPLVLDETRVLNELEDGRESIVGLPSSSRRK